MSFGPLITTQALADAAGAPDIRIMDTTFYLPNEGKDARAIFAAGHIPGAQFFDLDLIADPETDLPHMVPGAGRFARLVAELGISDTDRVVFYDQKGLFSAARGWWLMRLFGHARTAVLDGGLPKWQAEGRAVSQGGAAMPPTGQFNATLHTARLRGLGDMLDIVDTGAAVVLDARPAGRFAATAPEPRAGVAGGHMPGAISLPASTLLATDQTMLPPDALRRLFAEHGVDGRQPVVTTCGTGVTAAILTLGLAVAGLPEGSLYDGSWTEWGSRADTPKVMS